MLEEQEEKEEAADDNDDENRVNEDVLPGLEQIRAAKEIREKLRKAAADGKDFIPLNDEVPNEEDDSRLVRDKSDDSDEAFEEHRGTTIAFGAPKGPDQDFRDHRTRQSLNDSAVNDWEMELIRKGAGGQHYANGKQDEAEAAAAKAATDQMNPVRRKSVFQSSSKALKGLSVESVLKLVQKRRLDTKERCDILLRQIGSAGALSAEGTSELPEAKNLLETASSAYDFLQRMREYILNLISCVEYAEPLVQSLEEQVEKAAFDSQTYELNGELLDSCKQVFENVSDDYANLKQICARFDAFRLKYPQWFFGAHIDSSLLDLMTPFVRWELLWWPAFLSPAAMKLSDMNWFQAIAHFGDLSLAKTEVSFLQVLSETVLKKVGASL